MNLDQLFAASSGLKLPGGCDHCDAYQTTSKDEYGIFHITVHHDDWCPQLRARQTAK